jgi:hypothetical protein
MNLDQGIDIWYIHVCCKYVCMYIRTVSIKIILYVKFKYDFKQTNNTTRFMWYMYAFVSLKKYMLYMFELFSAAYMYWGLHVYIINNYKANVTTILLLNSIQGPVTVVLKQTIYGHILIMYVHLWNTYILFLCFEQFSTYIILRITWQ